MTKDSVIYVRVPATLYARAEEEANQRGESLSVIVREACRQYFDRIDNPVNSSASPAFSAIFDAAAHAARAGQGAPQPPVQPVKYTIQRQTKTPRKPAPKKKH